jgi:hypothetical protein
MPGSIRRVATAAVGALIGTVANTTATAAAVAARPAAEPISFDAVESWVAIPFAMLAMLVGSIVLLLVRPGWRRPIAALAVAAASLSLGAVLVLAGLFADWSGEHRIGWQFLAPGLAIIVGGLAVSARIARGGPRRSDGSVG